ncbi:MAG TPA: UdgX family uracil-DNA binding protein [Polyangiaceae bacterium]|nr:UdgX family uracil-DNA binding protein [Polyangiaceae bacterium]
MPARAPRATEEESAAAYLPERRTLKTLRDAARSCHGCGLWKNATQTVFGEGPRDARIVLVGEQPGNDEDLSGRPFVGPAGRILDEALEQAGIDRESSYVTNAVKHFKWIPKGTRRLHQKPGAREISACLPWLDAEIALLRPEVLVVLGATAAASVFGPAFRVSRERGKIVPSRFVEHTVATVHPSALLRLPPDADRDAELARFVEDLRVAAKLLGKKR